MADKYLIDRQMRAHLAWIDSALEYIKKTREMVETIHDDTRSNQDLAATLAMTVLQQLISEGGKKTSRLRKKNSRRPA